MKKIVIVGAGIAGLVSALLLLKKGYKDITIIEKCNEIGGLLNKYEYEEVGIFDYGMHNFLETGIKELDELIFNLLPENKWQILKQEKRDLAGVYVNKRVQKNSPYIDLRFREDYSELLRSFFDRDIDIKDITAFKSVEEYLNNRYGELITETVYGEILNKFFKKDKSELDPMAAVVTPLWRLILFNETIMDEINKSDKLRGLLGYTEQRNIDLNLTSGKSAYYPKEYGIYQIIDQLEVILKDADVKFILNDYIHKIDYDESIKKVYLNSGIEVDNVSHFIWTSSLNEVAKLLDIENENNTFDVAAKTSVTNIVIDKKLDLDDLYYIYCYDSDLATFRVTPYYNYSEGARVGENYKLCVEMLIYTESDTETLTLQAIEELKKMKLLKDNTNIIFAKTEILRNGFPRPTINNISIIDSYRDKIATKNLSNFTSAGILAEKNLFFQTDVLIDLYYKIEKITL